MMTSGRKPAHAHDSVASQHALSRENPLLDLVALVVGASAGFLVARLLSRHPPEVLTDRRATAYVAFLTAVTQRLYTLERYDDRNGEDAAMEIRKLDALLEPILLYGSPRVSRAAAKVMWALAATPAGIRGQEDDPRLAHLDFTRKRLDRYVAVAHRDLQGFWRL